MALPLKDAFTARAIGTAWDRYQQSLGLPPYLGRSFFGTQKKMGLDLKWIKGSHGLPVSLKGANFDAKAPLRDGIGFKMIEQGMPFFRESYLVTEQEEQDYMTFLNAQNESMANQVLAEIMKKPLDLVQGADVVPERMIWQLLAPANGIPQIVVNVDGGSTYVIDYTEDNGVAYKATNYTALSGTSLWSAASTATPIADLADMQEKYTTNHGGRLTTIVMNQTTWKQLVNAADTRTQVLGTIAASGGVMLRDSEVREFLLSNYDITVLVYNKMYMAENGTASTFIPNGVVVGIDGAASTLGTVFYGTTPEERSGDLSIGNLSIVNTGVSIYTYTTPHPINTHCVVSEIVLPSYENMDRVAILKVI